MRWHSRLSAALAVLILMNNGVISTADPSLSLRSPSVQLARANTQNKDDYKITRLLSANLKWLTNCFKPFKKGKD
ncbi:hypothetical protein Plhal304r1_c071g0159991 [Plasmopara halstedii]